MLALDCFLFHLGTKFQFCCISSWIVLLLYKSQWSVENIKVSRCWSSVTPNRSAWFLLLLIVIEPVNLYCCLALPNGDYFACVRLYGLKCRCTGARYAAASSSDTFEGKYIKEGSATQTWFFIFRISGKYQTMSFRLMVVLFPEQYR